MCHTKTPIDLAAADRIARGSSQKRWLQQMLSPTGLDPTDGKYGRYSRALWRRIGAFVDSLSLAGYATQELPLGPHGEQAFRHHRLRASRWAPASRHPR